MGCRRDVRRGEIVSIIGANGAGKSTLLRTMFGMVAPTRGSIRLAGEEIAGRRPVAVLRRGLLATCPRAAATSRR